MQLHDVLVSRRNIFIFMELCTNGNLFDMIVENEKFDEKMARKIFRQLVSGVGYFHDQGVCHRDLKVCEQEYIMASACENTPSTR